MNVTSVLLSQYKLWIIWGKRPKYAHTAKGFTTTSLLYDLTRVSLGLKRLRKAVGLTGIMHIFAAMFSGLCLICNCVAVYCLPAGCTHRWFKSIVCAYVSLWLLTSTRNIMFHFVTQHINEQLIDPLCYSHYRTQCHLLALPELWTVTVNSHSGAAEKQEHWALWE